MLRKDLWIAFCLLLAIPERLQSFANYEDTRKAEFLSVYAPELDSQRSLYLKNRRIQVVETRFFEDGTIEFKRQHDFLSDESAFLVKSISYVTSKLTNGKPVSVPVEKPTPSWGLLRPDRYFEIHQADNSDKYLITQMIAPISWEDASVLVPFHHALVGYTIANSLRRPTVRVSDLSRCEWEGRQLTRLQIEDQAPNGGVTTRSYLLDPEDHWRIYCLENQKTGFPFKLVERHQYIRSPESIVVPKRTIAEVEQPGKAARLVYVVEYNQYAEAHPDASEFLLARFGLSEPRPAVRAGPRWYVWLFCGSVLCAALSILVYRTSRRRRVGPLQ